MLAGEKLIPHTQLMGSAAGIGPDTPRSCDWKLPELINFDWELSRPDPIAAEKKAGSNGQNPSDVLSGEASDAENEASMVRL